MGNVLNKHGQSLLWRMHPSFLASLCSWWDTLLESAMGMCLQWFLWPLQESVSPCHTLLRTSTASCTPQTPLACCTNTALFITHCPGHGQFQHQRKHFDGVYNACCLSGGEWWKGQNASGNSSLCDVKRGYLMLSCRKKKPKDSTDFLGREILIALEEIVTLIKIRQNMSE